MTFVPEQMLSDGLAEIETLAGRFGFTVMVIAFEVAGFPVAQVALLVITHVIAFPLVSAASVYDELLVPTFVPFFFH